MAVQPKRRLTYADYVHFPDDRRWEIIEGEAFVSPSPTTRHQHIALEIAGTIRDHLKEHGGGRVFIAPLDVLLPDEQGDVVQPDVIFVSDDDAHVITDKHIRGAPTWIIEVVSDQVRDKKVKRDLYLHHGVREYWTVDPDLREVVIHLPGAVPVTVTDRATPSVLGGLTIDLVSLFAS